MRKLAGSTFGVFLAATIVLAQLPSERYTQPALPSEEALGRLNLAMAWHTYVPTDGRRDGFTTVQIHPHDILIQMRSGAVMALDAGTGALRWKVQVGLPYSPSNGLGSNASSVFVTKGNKLFALERASGVLRWQYSMPEVAAAAPVADDQSLFVPIGDRHLLALQLPGASAKGNGVEARTESPVEASSGLPTGSLLVPTPWREAQPEVTGPQPGVIYLYETGVKTDTRLEQESLIYSTGVLQAGSDGYIFGLPKAAPLRLTFSFDAPAAVSAPMGQHGDHAYVATADYRIYALDLGVGETQWRFVVGGAVLRKPRVLDDDVFISAVRNGLYRLNRATGDLTWQNPSAERFLAANKKFVYATNMAGRVQVLDRIRGTTLGVLDASRDFVFPISNETTDRLFLASQNGMIVCLHDRDYPTPLLVKNVPPPPPPAQAPPLRKRAPKADEAAPDK
jgi:outer membrane protein assembly factor BamB